MNFLFVLFLQLWLGEAAATARPPASGHLRGRDWGRDSRSGWHGYGHRHQGQHGADRYSSQQLHHIHHFRHHGPFHPHYQDDHAGQGEWQDSNAAEMLNRVISSLYSAWSVCSLSFFFCFSLSSLYSGLLVLYLFGVFLSFVCLSCLFFGVVFGFCKFFGFLNFIFIFLIIPLFLFYFLFAYLLIFLFVSV